MPAKLKTVTLGCKVNQYETQFVREGLESIGFQPVTEKESADLCIVNTCTVTNEGDSKSRQIIRRLHRDQPDARIVVMGCYATRAPEEIAALPGVAEVVTDKRELPDLLGRFGVRDIPDGISGLDGRSRAYVKVQDGCLLRCSYCIIPKVRPEMYSRELESVVEEVQRMVDRGYREIVLTGVHLGHYGVDLNRGQPKESWVRLARLLERLSSLSGEFRVRLSSIEATEVTQELLQVMQDFSDRVCPHLHVCLQSGSEEILRRMKRRWGVKRLVDRCELIKDVLDCPALTTDVIVGFPGETEAHFEQSMDICRQIGFSKIHAFPFSARKGTPAADYPDQLTKEVKSRRVHALGQLEKELRETYFAELVNRELEVLVEKCDPIDISTGLQNGADLPGRFRCSGTSCRYAPTEFLSDQDLSRQLVKSIPVSTDGTKLIATPHLPPGI